MMEEIGLAPSDGAAYVLKFSDIKLLQAINKSGSVHEGTLRGNRKVRMHAWTEASKPVLYPASTAPKCRSSMHGQYQLQLRCIVPLTTIFLHDNTTPAAMHAWYPTAMHGSMVPSRHAWCPAAMQASMYRYIAMIPCLPIIHQMVLLAAPSPHGDSPSPPSRGRPQSLLTGTSQPCFPQVAVKVFNLEDSDAPLRRLLKVAFVASRDCHHVCRYIGVATTNRGKQFLLVMQRYQGSLAAHVRAAPGAAMLTAFCSTATMDRQFNCSCSSGFDDHCVQAQLL